MPANVGSGDRGMTSLLSGERVPKTHPRVEACGELDELSSLLGVVGAALPAGSGVEAARLRAVQADLFGIGAVLAATPGSEAAGMVRAPGVERLAALEAAVAELEAGLAPLQTFILPGGDPAAAAAHHARSVCRRAERRAAAVGEGLPPGVLPYLNRLSTYLFALARWCNRTRGVPDVPWKG